MVARRAHNPKVVGSNPAPATTILKKPNLFNKLGFFIACLTDIKKRMPKHPFSIPYKLNLKA